MLSGERGGAGNHRDIQCFLAVIVHSILKKQKGLEGMLRPSFKTTVHYKTINSFPELKGAFGCFMALQYT